MPNTFAPKAGSYWRGLGLWNVYFIAKLMLYAAGYLNFHAFYNLVFASVLLMPLPPLWLHRARHIAAIPVGVALLYYDSWLPPFRRLLEQPEVLQLSAPYLLELLNRFINWNMVGAGLLLFVVFLFLSQWIRVTVFSVTALVLVSLPPQLSVRQLAMNLFEGHSGLDVQAQPKPGLSAEEPGADAPRPRSVTEILNDELQQFYAAEAERRTEFALEPGFEPDFDIVFLNICSVAWADLASYFGTLSGWHRAQIPAHYNSLPASHAIVFATNDERPDFLSLYPRVDGPTVAMITQPDNPYLKLLLILGRDAPDLVTATSALAVGTTVFRGQSVQVGELRQLAPRRPYDAPKWAPTDRPVSFAELLDYPGQLDVSGLFPRPITLSVNLPPDLFVWRNSGIPASIRYRYSAPRNNDDSRLSLSLNGRFVDSYPLRTGEGETVVSRTRLAIRPSENAGDSERIVMPALKLGGRNQLQFDFSFASVMSSAQRDACQTVLPVDVRAAIDEQSTLDFSGFYHYMEMPNLRSFAGSGFPFSRMADLSETIVVLPEQPTVAQVTTLFETLGGIGAQVGYPAVGLLISHDWHAAHTRDADILLIGAMPESMKASPNASVLLRDTQTALQRPRRPGFAGSRAAVAAGLDGMHDDARPVNQVMVQSLAPLAAVVGMQSAYHAGRSVVALLGSTDEDFRLLREALADSGKRESMRGSVVLIRESGVASEMVGPHYYVGYLPWWQKVWFALSDRPLILGLGTIVIVLVMAALLWRGLYRVARRRLRRAD